MVTQDVTDAQTDEGNLNLDGNHQNESDDSDPKIIRYKQLMKGSKDEAERAIADAVDANTQLVLADKDRFLDLYAKNPVLAERVAKNFEGINSAKELINYIKGTTIQEDPKPRVIDEDAIATRVRQQIEQENAMMKAEKQFENLTQEQEELAKKHFEKITK